MAKDAIDQYKNDTLRQVKKRRIETTPPVRQQILQHLLVLGHCVRCNSACQSENCRRMSQLMDHRIVCRVDHCVLCTRIDKLYRFHRAVCDLRDSCRICSGNAVAVARATPVQDQVPIMQ